MTRSVIVERKRNTTVIKQDAIKIATENSTNMNDLLSQNHVEYHRLSRSLYTQSNNCTGLTKRKQLLTMTGESTSSLLHHLHIIKPL